jgi:phage-related protein
VKEFIDSLHHRTQQKFFAAVHLLQRYGKALPEPHADSLGDGIYELRFIGLEGKVRILYFFYDQDKIILTNGFVKKSPKPPRQEVEAARQRRKEYLQR